MTYAKGPIPDDKHGTNSGYRWYNCRCPRCSRAAAKYRKRYAVERQQGKLRLVPVLATKRRIQGLMAQGYRQQDIADLMGFGHNVVSHILNGRRTYLSQKNVSEFKRIANRLARTQGPSDITRTRALKSGWIPLALWENIEDPDEQPPWWDIRTSSKQTPCPVCHKEFAPGNALRHVKRLHPDFTNLPNNDNENNNAA